MTIKDIISSVASQLSYSQGSKITTTEFSFALITRISSKMLLIFAFIITIRQLFGWEFNIWCVMQIIFIVSDLRLYIRRKPIECQTDPSYERYTSQIETRCWIEGSFIIREQLTGVIGKNLVNYGVGTKMRTEERIYQTYYQWVTPTFLIMSLIFYFPHFLWHNWECGTMEKLLKDIGENSTRHEAWGNNIFIYKPLDSPYINEECWNNQRDRLMRYLHGPKRYHRQYAIKYYICELIAFFALVRFN